MITMVKRNVKLYFRSKAMVISSFMSVMIIIGLYALFLEDVILADIGSYDYIEEFTKTWIMSGLIAVTTITTALTGAQTMMLDRHNKTYQDFAVAPMKRVYLVGGYAGSTFLISLIMTVFTFAIAQIYLVVVGLPMFKIYDMLRMIVLIILSSLSVSFTIFYMVCKIKKIHTFSVVSTIITTIVGFMTGILIPMGNMPEFLRTLVIVFPFSHSALLYRNIMLPDIMEKLFNGAPESVLTQFKYDMGITYSVGKNSIDPYVSIIYLLIVAIVMFLLSIRQISKKQDTL